MNLDLEQIEEIRSLYPVSVVAAQWDALCDMAVSSLHSEIAGKTDRDAIIEECAKVCDARFDESDALCTRVATYCAISIRALKTAAPQVRGSLSELPHSAAISEPAVTAASEKRITPEFAADVERELAEAHGFVPAGTPSADGVKSGMAMSMAPGPTRGEATVRDLRRLSHHLTLPDERELVQHAADMIEVLAKLLEGKRLSECPKRLPQDIIGGEPSGDVEKR